MSAAQPDPRFEAVLNLIRSGEFGWEGYFAQLIDSLSGSSDYYLLANDFPSYLEAQVCGSLHTTSVAHMLGAWGRSIVSNQTPSTEGRCGTVNGVPAVRVEGTD
jgi:glucan phosphorylase